MHCEVCECALEWWIIVFGSEYGKSMSRHKIGSWTSIPTKILDKAHVVCSIQRPNTPCEFTVYKTCIIDQLALSLTLNCKLIHILHYDYHFWKKILYMCTYIWNLMIIKLQIQIANLFLANFDLEKYLKYKSINSIIHFYTQILIFFKFLIS